MRHRSQPWLNNISPQNKTMKGRSIQRFSLENTIQTIVPFFFGWGRMILSQQLHVAHRQPNVARVLWAAAMCLLSPRAAEM